MKRSCNVVEASLFLFVFLFWCGRRTHSHYQPTPTPPPPTTISINRHLHHHSSSQQSPLPCPGLDPPQPVIFHPTTESCYSNSDAFLKPKHKTNSFFTVPSLFVGLNPINLTTHIFGDCVLERHEDEFIAKSLKCEEHAIKPAEIENSYLRDNFLSFCYSCKKKLEGEDIYMYSWNRRAEEILIVEEMEKNTVLIPPQNNYLIYFVLY
ncbi:putative Zf-FLZ domain-containing protein [Helianthus anomalus]